MGQEKQGVETYTQNDANDMTDEELRLKPLGPLLDADADFLKAIIGMTTPLVVLEFGFLYGDSARAMLSAMRHDARLISIDKDRWSNIENEPRFTFHQVSQETFIPEEIVDFVFLDASHELEINKQTFMNIVPHLSEKAIIAIHDTGKWPHNVYQFNAGMDTSDGRYSHCPDEIRFTNWLQDEHPDWQQIHFHSDRETRHGITLLQKKTRLFL